MRAALSRRGLLGLAAGLALVLMPVGARAAEKLTPEEALKLVARMEENSAFGTGATYLALINETFGETKILREVIIHQRGVEPQNSVMLVSRPKTQAGNGFLRVDRNVWSYAASTGKWERRTERDQFEGTNMRGSDFGGAAFALKYSAVDGGEELVGKVTARKIELTAKPDADVPFPKVILWLDENLNTVKRQDFALSGKLMRTTLATVQKLERGAGSPPVWAPKQLHVQDEVNTNRVSVVLFRAFDFKPLDSSLFTKAWLESKSR